MPFVQGKPRKVSKRHIIGYKQIRGKGGVLSSVKRIDKEVSKVDQEKIILWQKILLPERYGVARYKTGTAGGGYFPEFVAGDVPSVAFGTQTIRSEDLYVHTYNDYDFFCEKDGAWLVSVFLKITLTQPTTTQVDSHTLYLYKSGSVYSTLDLQETSVTIGSTAYESIVTLQGTDVLTLVKGDYITIKYELTAAADLTASDSCEGYLNIIYQTKQAEKLV